MSFFYVVCKLLVAYNLVAVCSCELTYLFRVNQLNNSTKISYFGCDANSNGFIFMDATNLLYKAMITNINPLNDTISSGVYSLSLNIWTQFRIFQTNTIANSNNTFLTFTNNMIILRTNNLLTSSTIYFILFGEIIYDARFGTNTSEIFAIIKLGTGNYTINYFIGATRIIRKTINSTLYGNYVQSKLYSSTLYVIFQKGIAIYTADSNLNEIKIIIFVNPTNTTIVSLSANSIYIAYCYDKQCFVCDSNNSYVVIDSFNKTSVVADIQLAPPYIFITTSGALIDQYDMDLKSVVVSIKTDVNGNGFTNLKNYRTNILYDKYLLYSQPFPNTYTYTYYFKFNNSYPCSGACSNCQTTYSPNATMKKCIKNYTNTVLENYTVPEVNYTNISINSSGFIYSSMVTTFNGTYNISNSTSVANNSLGQQISSTDPLDKWLTLLGKSLTFASMKFNPKFLVSLVFFLDDLWYYRYHNNNYTKSAKFFMEKVNIVNQLRLSAWFLQIINFANNNLVCVIKNNIYMQYQKYGSPKLSQIYFLNSSEEVYKQYFILGCLTFLILKCVSMLFFIFQNYSPFISRIYKMLKRNTSPIIFIANMLQINMIILAFNFSVQALSFYRFDFVDTINMVLTTLTFLCLLLYSLLYYPLLLNYRTKLIIGQLLIRSKHKLSGCFTQLITICFRNLVRSLIHGILIQNYEGQIVALIFSDLLFISLTFIFRHNYQNKVLFGAAFLYNIIFMAVDTLFLIQYKNPTFMNNSTYDLVVFILICTLIALSLLISLTILLKQLYIFAKKYFHTLRSQKQKSKKQIMQNEIKEIKSYIKKQKVNQKLTIIQAMTASKNKKKINTFIEKNNEAENTISKQNIKRQVQEQSRCQRQRTFSPVTKENKNSQLQNQNQYSNNSLQSIKKIKVRMLTSNKIKPQKSKYFTYLKTGNKQNQQKHGTQIKLKELIAEGKNKEIFPFEEQILPDISHLLVRKKQKAKIKRDWQTVDEGQ